MLIALLASFSPDAAACSPGPASVVATVPTDGATDVPIDADVVISMANGYIGLDDDMDVQMFVNGAAVPGTTTDWSRTVNLTEQVGQVRFSPDDALTPGDEVTVEITGVGWGSDLTTISFTVGSAAALPVTGSPEMTEVALSEQRADAGQSNSCETQKWRKGSISADAAHVPADGLSWMLLYRVDPDDPDTLPDRPFDVSSPLSAAGAVRWGVEISYDLDRDLMDECYVAVLVDGAGVAGEPSEMLCNDPAASSPTTGSGELDSGCSVVGGAATSAWALGLLAVGLRRRRG